MNRQIYTDVNNTHSDLCTIKYGVPQGSVLGPILFIIYINDIKSLSINCKINLFADDTSIFCSENSYDELEETTNEVLHRVNKWLCVNSLSLNLNKTHYLVFSKRNTNSSLTIKLGNRNIQQANSTKYLGLIIQDNLKWNLHINKTVNKLNTLIPIFYHLRGILTKSQALMVYKSLALSKLTYAVELYGRKNTKWLQQLQKTQNRLLKILLFKRRMQRTNELHTENKMLKIHDQTNLRLLLLVFDNKNMISQQENYNLRNRLNIPVQSETFNYINKVTDEAKIRWNTFPNRFKVLQKREQFKHEVTKFMIKSYGE